MKKNNNTSELDDLLANVEDIDFVFEDDTISDTDESDESEEDDIYLSGALFRFRL